MTYELPADSYDGRVELQTLARRIARACVHYIQVGTPHPHTSGRALTIPFPPTTVLIRRRI